MFNESSTPYVSLFHLHSHILVVLYQLLFFSFYPKSALLLLHLSSNVHHVSNPSHFYSVMSLTGLQFFSVFLSIPESPFTWSLCSTFLCNELEFSKAIYNSCNAPHWFHAIAKYMNDVLVKNLRFLLRWGNVPNITQLGLNHFQISG